MRIQSMLAILLATAVSTSGCFGFLKSDDGGEETVVEEPKGEMTLGFQPPKREEQPPANIGQGGDGDDGQAREDDPDEEDEEEWPEAEEQDARPGLFQTLMMKRWDIVGHGVETEVNAAGFVFEAGIKEWRPQDLDAENGRDNLGYAPEPYVSRYCVLIEQPAPDELDVTDPELEWETETVRSWNLRTADYHGYQEAMGSIFNPNSPEAWMYYNEGDAFSYRNVSVAKFQVSLASMSNDVDAPDHDEVVCDKDSVSDPSMQANIWVPAGHGSSDDFWPVVHLDFQTDDDHRGVWEYHRPDEVQTPTIYPGTALGDTWEEIEGEVGGPVGTPGNAAQDVEKQAEELLTSDQLENTSVDATVKLPYMAGDSFVAHPEAHLILAIFGLDMVVEKWQPGESVLDGVTVTPHMDQIGTNDVVEWTRSESNYRFAGTTFHPLVNDINDNLWGSDESDDDGLQEILPVLGQEVGGIPQTDARELSDEYTYSVPANEATGQEKKLVSQVYAVKFSEGVPLPFHIAIGVKHHLPGTGQEVDGERTVKADEMGSVHSSVYTDHVMIELEMAGIVNMAKEFIPNEAGEVPNPEAFLEDPEGVCTSLNLGEDCMSPTGSGGNDEAGDA